MSSALGFPDWQRITQWFGNPLDKATGYALGNGSKVVGPLNVRSFASIVVCVRPVGGSVTVTVTQQVPGGAAGLTVASSFVVNAGNSVFEAFVLLAGSATVTFQGSAPGETLDYAIVPSNTNTNAEVAALTQLGFQHNDVVVATETAIDLEDAAEVGWTFVDDPVNLRVKITPTLRQNGAGTGALYRWTGAAWVPTTKAVFDDATGELDITGTIKSLAGGNSFWTEVGAGQRVLQNYLVHGDVNPAVAVLGDGTYSVGPGGGSVMDTTLKRSAAGRWQMNGGLDLSAGSLLPQLSAGSAVFAVDGSAGASLAIANGATGTPFSNANNFSGFVVIEEFTALGVCGAFVCGGGVVTALAPAAYFSTALGTAGRINVAYSAGNALVIENLLGSGITVRVYAVRLRPNL